jgi:Dockerin type I domain
MIYHVPNRLWLLLFCSIGIFTNLFAQNIIAFGKDTVVVSSTTAEAYQWLNAHPFHLKSMKYPPSPSNPGYYADTTVTVTFTDNGMIDNCGNGKVSRTYKLTAKGKSKTVVFSYTSENRSAFTVTFPKDTVILAQNILPNTTTFSEKNTGEPIIKILIGNPLTGIEREDKIFIVTNLPKFHYKLVRKWLVLNWCQPMNLNPNSGEVRKFGSDCKEQSRTYTNFDTLTLDRTKSVFDPTQVFSKEMKNLKEQEKCYVYNTDGYMEYYQNITLIDSIPPDLKMYKIPTLAPVKNECKTEVTIYNPKIYDATLKEWSFSLINPKNNQIVLSGKTFPTTVKISKEDFGTYILRYFAKDALGNESSLDHTFEVYDVEKPTVICKMGYTKDFDPKTKLLIINAKELDNGSFDGCGGSLTFKLQEHLEPNIKFDSTLGKDALKIPCTGLRTMVLWAIDKYGNANYCETYIESQNNFNVKNIPPCIMEPPAGVKIDFSLKKENNEIANGTVKIKSNIFKNGLFEKNTENGLATVFAIYSSDLIISVENDKNAANGVTTADLLLLSQHILGHKILTSKYKKIAADVNNNGVISSIDLILIQKMILGQITSFYDNSSWKFFADTTLNSTISINNLTEDTTLNFTAVKIGDLNDSAAASNIPSAPRGEQPTLYVETDEQNFETGEEVVFDYKMPNVDAYQSSIFYDEKTLQLIDIQGNKDNFYLKKNGAIAVSELLIGEQKMSSSLRFRALQKGKLSEHIRLSSELISSEAYLKDETFDLKLRFKNDAESSFELYQNQPNPFDAATKITFSSPSQNVATLKIYDLNGRTIFQKELSCEKGYNEFLFEKNNLTNGLFRYELMINGEKKSKNMLKL